MASEGQVTVLHFVSGKYEGSEFPLDGENFIAGRSTEADLVLADDAVSRKHARFYRARGRHWVRDLGSSNGTHVNGAPAGHHCLHEGDRIAIGSSLCRVDIRDPTNIGKRAGEQRRRRPNDSAGRSMTGSIEDIPLMDVLQWLATSRKTGALKVKDEDGGREGALHLREGQVFYAVIGNNDGLHPEKALMRMLNWDKGMFELDNLSLDEVPVEISMSLEHMLMEAARQQDELANLAKKSPLPKRGTTVKLVSPSPVRWHELKEDEVNLIQDIIEVGGWWKVLDGSSKDDLSLYRVLLALKKKGVMEYS